MMLFSVCGLPVDLVHKEKSWVFGALVPYLKLSDLPTGIKKSDLRDIRLAIKQKFWEAEIYLIKKYLGKGNFFKSENFLNILIKFHFFF